MLGFSQEAFEVTFSAPSGMRKWHSPKLFNKPEHKGLLRAVYLSGALLKGTAGK